MSTKAETSILTNRVIFLSADAETWYSVNVNHKSAVIGIWQKIRHFEGESVGTAFSLLICCRIHRHFLAS